jgi:pimeloyl-ACP methyl ester carboxylesterase
MATFLLVHGAWHWGDCWQDVRNRLEFNGHRVYSPTLAGMGETACLLEQRPRPQIGLATHIKQITNVVRNIYDPTSSIILVAHSYAGLVASGVVQALTESGELEKISHLVLLDAMIPTPRQPTVMSLFPIENPPEWLTPWIKQNFAIKRLVRSLPIPPPPVQFLGFINENSEQAQSLKAHLTACPVRFREGLWRIPTPSGIPITYIHCQLAIEEMSFFPTHASEFARRQGWPVHTLPCGHDAMLLLPEEVSTILLNINVTSSEAESFQELPA